MIMREPLQLHIRRAPPPSKSALRIPTGMAAMSAHRCQIEVQNTRHAANRSVRAMNALIGQVVGQFEKVEKTSATVGPMGRLVSVLTRVTVVRLHLLASIRSALTSKTEDPLGAVTS